MAEGWRGRPRSPLTRYEDSHGRETRPRSPRRAYAGQESRYDSTGRPRSPLTSDRPRPRSPPRRPYSPANRPGYRPRSRSPRRDDRDRDRAVSHATSSYRRRSPSPHGHRSDLRPAEGFGRDAGPGSQHNSSYRYDRKAPTAQHEGSDFRGPSASSYRSPAHHNSQDRHRDDVDQHARPRHPSEREFIRENNGYNSRIPESITSTEHRAPPTAPRSTAVSPPTGPASQTTSSYNRRDMAGVPSHPRGSYRGRGGGPQPGREWPSRDHGGHRRGGWEGSGGGPSPRDVSSRDSFHDSRGPPHGHPRHSFSSTGTGGPPFRGVGNSTSTTYPRTQRFNQALQDLPKPKEGGERYPPLHDTAKADKLEEEAARLRKMIDEKEAKKRQGLREWDRLERESSTAALKSELAEEHLRSLNGESEGISAAF